MKKPILQKFAPALWIFAGVLFLLPSIFNSSINTASIGVGIMFIIFGIIFFKKTKSDTSHSKKP
jgi:hypothetical protein